MLPSGFRSRLDAGILPMLCFYDLRGIAKNRLTCFNWLYHDRPRSYPRAFANGDAGDNNHSGSDKHFVRNCHVGIDSRAGSHLDEIAEYSFRTDYSTCVNETMANQGCTGSHHHPHVGKVTRANRRNIGNDGGLMNAVYRLNMAFLMEHFDKTFSQRVVVEGNERFAFASNKLQEAVIIRCTQY